MSDMRVSEDISNVQGVYYYPCTCGRKHSVPYVKDYGSKTTRPLTYAMAEKLAADPGFKGFSPMALEPIRRILNMCNKDD